MVTEAATCDYEKEERMNQPGIVGYIVKDGDDLWSLAKKYSTTEESILLNNELLSKELKTGDKILIFRESLRYYSNEMMYTRYKKRSKKYNKEIHAWINWS